MSGVIKKTGWLLPALLLLTAGTALAQQGNGIQSAANIESHISVLSVLRGLLGIAVLIGIAWLFSNNRKAISWKVVGMGLVIQLVLAVGILYVPFVQAFFEFFGKIFLTILDFTKAGSDFLLGDLMDTTKVGYVFAFQVLPTIIFFSALTSLLFYLGIIQKVVYALAWGMTKLMNISGMEALSVSGNIFLGQTEAPLMIKEYLDDMTPSEIFLVMTGGMATIAGGSFGGLHQFPGRGRPCTEAGICQTSAGGFGHGGSGSGGICQTVGTAKQSGKQQHTGIQKQSGEKHSGCYLERYDGRRETGC